MYLSIKFLALSEIGISGGKIKVSLQFITFLYVSAIIKYKSCQITTCKWKVLQPLSQPLQLIYIFTNH